MAKLTPALIRIFVKEGKPVEFDGQISLSGRWAIFEYPGGRRNKTFWQVLHVPTGIALRLGLKVTAAKRLLAAVEEVETPDLDALEFGQLAYTPEAKADLRKLVEVMRPLIEDGLL